MSFNLRLLISNMVSSSFCKKLRHVVNNPQTILIPHLYYPYITKCGINSKQYLKNSTPSHILFLLCRTNCSACADCQPWYKSSLILKIYISSNYRWISVSQCIIFILYRYFDKLLVYCFPDI
jgi:hypothetical protein